MAGPEDQAARGRPLLNFLAPAERIRRRILFDASVSGIANAALLMVSNKAALRGATVFDLLLFAGLFVAYTFTFRGCFSRVTMLFETAIEQARVRMADKLRRLDLTDLGQLDRAVVYNRLAQQTGVIAETAGVLAASLQSAVLVAFTAFYLATISLPAVLLAITVIGGGTLIFFRRTGTVSASMREASAREMDLFDGIGDLIDGFKELKLNQRRSDALHARISGASAAVRTLRVTTAGLFDTNYIFAYSLFYMLIGLLVFVLPNYQVAATEGVIRVTAIVLFVIGPMSVVVAGVPAWSKSTHAASAIAALEADLDRLGARHAGFTAAPAAAPAGFSAIELRAVRFHYKGASDAFAVGPIDLTVTREEILYVIGGNGSGKSTFMKLLCALYQADSGEILLDGRLLTPSWTQPYREMFTAVFSDFHLFRTLEGLGEIPVERVDALLRLMRLDSKVRFDGAAFSTLDLSTGQRKRLALVVALLEDRPIMIFDEWAADQDPQFRSYFYETLLPDLKRLGKTVIVVTHDERHLRRADRLIQMADGMLFPYVPPAEAT